MWQPPCTPAVSWLIAHERIFKYMKKVIMVISVLILLTSLFLSQQIITKSITNQVNKKESAELNDIRYGLLSIDSWKKQMSVIILKEIENIDLAEDYESEIQSTVESQLYVLIDKVNERIKESNKDTFKGRLKQTFINVFVSIEDIKKGVPEYADAMIAEMKKKRNQNKLKAVLKEKVSTYIDQTFDTQDMSQVKRILERTSSPNIEAARVKLASAITDIKATIFDQSVILMIISIILFIIPALTKKPLQPFQYFVLILSLIILLVVGVTTPMIDMEAKISKMTFVLMENPIVFENQVLFFQTKSVLDVFWIMITHETLQMKAVGLLMVAFSVVFPILKLISSFIFYYDFKQARSNKWVQFFVIKSGKWSMADVMVVAIFMAFIGFNGIITSQIGKLSTTSQDIVILSTNGTALQPGYYLFFTYAMLAMFLSQYLAKLDTKKGLLN